MSDVYIETDVNHSFINYLATQHKSQELATTKLSQTPDAR
jgi:hypothetical protein